MSRVTCYNTRCPFATSDHTCAKQTELRVNADGDCETYLKAIAVKCTRMDCVSYSAGRCSLRDIAIGSTGSCRSYKSIQDGGAK